MDAPKLRLIVSGTLIEGRQVTLDELSEADRAGAEALIGFLGGPKQILVLRNPLVHQGDDLVRSSYLVVRQDKVEACAFVEESGAPVSAASEFGQGWND